MTDVLVKLPAQKKFRKVRKAKSKENLSSPEKAIVKHRTSNVCPWPSCGKEDSFEILNHISNISYYIVDQDGNFLPDEKGQPKMVSETLFTYPERFCTSCKRRSSLDGKISI